MELSVVKQPVIINETAYEGSLEQPVECDILLPDYCPDIVKILRCFCTAAVTGTQVTAEKFTVELTCTVTVCYLGADHSIRSMEQRLPYSKTTDLKTAAQNPVADVSCKTEYVNCRAVSQRRLEARCALTLFCRVFSQTSAELVSDASGCGIQLKTSSCDLTELCGDVTRPFSLHEDLQLPSSKPPVRGVIRHDCCCRIGDCKVISGKVIVKGDLLIRILYQPESEGARPEMMEYSLPLSQIVDIDGVDEESICDVELAVISCELTPKTDLEGESRLIAMDCSMKARVRSHRRKKLRLITDCYSTLCDSRCERVPVSCLSLIKVVDEKFLHKCTLSLPDDSGNVIDLFCMVTEASARVDSGSVTAVIQLLLCVFALDAQGEPYYYEQPEECEVRVPVDASCEGMIFVPRASVLSAAFSISGNDSLECRIELQVGGCIYSMTRPKACTAITADTASPKERCEDASLIIYYASGGEDVWEIAKRYNTALDAVMGENALESTTLPDKRMLLIPIV